MAPQPDATARAFLARRPYWCVLWFLAASLLMSGCLDQAIDGSMARLTGDAQDLSATLTPDQVLAGMAATFQDMDALSVQLRGSLRYALHPSEETGGHLLLARPGKAYWIQEDNSHGLSVESVVSDGTPDGLVRWDYYPADSTYRLRTDTAEDWGFLPDQFLSHNLPLAGALFHGGRLEDWGSLGWMFSVEEVLPEGAVSRPLEFSLFSPDEALPVLEDFEDLPACDCFGVEGWYALQQEGPDREGMAMRLRLWVGKADFLLRRLELVTYSLKPGPWTPQDPLSAARRWGLGALSPSREDLPGPAVSPDAPIPFAVTRETYSNYLPNEPIPEDTFKPHIPEGATLIEDEPAPEPPEI